MKLSISFTLLSVVAFVAAAPVAQVPGVGQLCGIAGSLPLLGSFCNPPPSNPPSSTPATAPVTDAPVGDTPSTATGDGQTDGDADDGAKAKRQLPGGVSTDQLKALCPVLSTLGPAGLPTGLPGGVSLDMLTSFCQTQPPVTPPPTTGPTSDTPTDTAAVDGAAGTDGAATTKRQLPGLDAACPVVGKLPVPVPGIDCKPKTPAGGAPPA